MVSPASVGRKRERSALEKAGPVPLIAYQLYRSVLCWRNMGMWSFPLGLVYNYFKSTKRNTTIFVVFCLVFPGKFPKYLIFKTQYLKIIFKATIKSILRTIISIPSSSHYPLISNILRQDSIYINRKQQISRPITKDQSTRKTTLLCITSTTYYRTT